MGINQEEFNREFWNLIEMPDDDARKKEYRNLAKKYHPDKNLDNKDLANELSKKLSEWKNDPDAVKAKEHAARRPVYNPSSYAPRYSNPSQPGYSQSRADATNNGRPSGSYRNEAPRQGYSWGGSEGYNYNFGGGNYSRYGADARNRGFDFEEAQRRAEELRRRAEEAQRRAQAQAEEDRRFNEEVRRRAEELRRYAEDIRRRMNEERARQEEAQRRAQAQDEEDRRFNEEVRRRAEEAREAEMKKRAEELRRRAEKAQKEAEEARRRDEELRMKAQEAMKKQYQERAQNNKREELENFDDQGETILTGTIKGFLEGESAKFNNQFDRDLFLENFNSVINGTKGPLGFVERLPNSALLNIRNKKGESPIFLIRQIQDENVRNECFKIVNNKLRFEETASLLESKIPALKQEILQRTQDYYYSGARFNKEEEDSLVYRLHQIRRSTDYLDLANEDGEYKNFHDARQFLDAKIVADYLYQGKAKIRNDDLTASKTKKALESQEKPIDYTPELVQAVQNVQYSRSYQSGDGKNYRTLSISNNGKLEYLIVEIDNQGKPQNITLCGNHLQITGNNKLANTFAVKKAIGDFVALENILASRIQAGAGLSSLNAIVEKDPQDNSKLQIIESKFEESKKDYIKNSFDAAVIFALSKTAGLKDPVKAYKQSQKLVARKQIENLSKLAKSDSVFKEEAKEELQNILQFLDQENLPALKIATKVVQKHVLLPELNQDSQNIVKTYIEANSVIGKLSKMISSLHKNSATEEGSKKEEDKIFAEAKQFVRQDHKDKKEGLNKLNGIKERLLSISPFRRKKIEIDSQSVSSEDSFIKKDQSPNKTEELLQEFKDKKTSAKGVRRIAVQPLSPQRDSRQNDSGISAQH